MDNTQAKIILSTCRPGGQDADDPHFAEALDQMQRDPELAQWFAAERAMDAAIAARIKAVPVPVDLKAALLAGRKVNRRAGWWTHPPVWAAAAGFVLLLALGAMHFRSSRALQFTEYQAHVGRFLDGLDRLDYQHAEAPALREWLAQHQGHANLALPKGLEGLTGLGCRVFEWQGRKVSLLCFKAGPGGFRDEVHLLVINLADLPTAPPPGSPQFSKTGGWTLASWSQGGHAYILAGLGNQECLRKLL
ncbi:MAG: hypothetical protein HZA89_07175 [Verrucomicrobia bacterium]|nr:hypothetical protein [Verrucomicrobiota bacterium]